MVKSGDDTEHARRDFYRDPQLKPEDDIEGSSWGMTQSLGILNLSLGILDFIARNSRILLALVGQAPLLANFIRAVP